MSTQTNIVYGMYSGLALIRVPGGGHGPGFADPPNPPDYIGATIKWFDRYLLGAD
jgi:hypothetical protein